MYFDVTVSATGTRLRYKRPPPRLVYKTLQKTTWSEFLKKKEKRSGLLIYNFTLDHQTTIVFGYAAAGRTAL